MSKEIKINCKLEEYARIFAILKELRYGYQTGDFTGLFPYLAKDCIFESQWVLMPHTGSDEIISYLTKKGETLQKSDNFPVCIMVELIGSKQKIENARVYANGSNEAQNASVTFIHEEGKPCLLLEQTINGETNDIILDVKIDEEGLAKRIDLCMPELFKYDEFFEYADIYPSMDAIDSEILEDEHPICIQISESHLSALSFFSSCVDCTFDGYGYGSIPFERWLKLLEYWEIFLDAKNFDKAFEKIAGANYKTGVIERPDLARRLGMHGGKCWEKRSRSKQLVKNLLEWSNVYKDTYKYVNLIGE